MLQYFIDNAHIGMVDIKHIPQGRSNIYATINKINNLAPCFAHIQISL